MENSECDCHKNKIFHFLYLRLSFHVLPREDYLLNMPGFLLFEYKSNISRKSEGLINKQKQAKPSKNKQNLGSAVETEFDWENMLSKAQAKLSESEIGVLFCWKKEEERRRKEKESGKHFSGLKKKYKKN